jgi:hypothetical protein
MKCVDCLGKVSMSADVLAMIVVLYGEPDGHDIAPNTRIKPTREAGSA